MTITDLRSSKLLEARIDHDLNHVSADGKTVTIAFRCLIHSYTRFFSLPFYDKAAALHFCNVLQEKLPRRVQQDLQLLRSPYHELVRRSQEVEKFKQRRRIKAKTVEGMEDRMVEEEGKEEEEQKVELEEEVDVVEEDVEGKEEEVEVLSDNDDDLREEVEDRKQEDEEARRKRKRLDPELEDAQDPILILNQDFEEAQFGSSQCKYF